ncbi:MAG: hypothetical protein A2W61_08180 [Deltaproteobacteria bacterium RIFCSPLOWO2_01_44_7]|nr:MAG: hypothetical protein A2712_09595 [Deltaproteobacteria bacterium RIFCSPHIGHO2_01_FULL_43_49]OGQ14929.1 MAG: hypothetical protein A3D22_00090 [Deltaproteobacteria bacterium RIFCSPHIGHO2_02_FULL_44_53]OGQ29567.1 MAG: hypothetical protein A3D98_10325 [Deltaproteobacteria bacterium RIFCSPHIGHO2_12_FULL_44_21]OGQ31041.1 MAG: hypothetical protein A2979_06380 [Deltaproteobacteria bacterium RIFCSPLOWO2_01_FULL_45_74]OGQ40032.1 MAG: hypothetical protein A2W61_08180 [Deltaproteobacteria bacterium 
MDKNYWQSLEELAETPELEEVQGKEFLYTPEELATQDQSDEKSGVTRREFLRLMGAGLVMASAAACTRRPVEKIVPYLNKPEEVTLGVANWYASTCGECPAACGILAKTREGRPIKLEGNPDHPMNKGGLCARGQASILNLYDPDRLKGPLQKVGDNWEAASWDKVDETLASLIKGVQEKGGQIRLLTGHVVSPSTRQLIQEFLSGVPNAKQIVFEPLGLEDLMKGQEACYGQSVLPRYRFEKAKMVVSFGADFLDTWLSPVEFTNRFSKTRKLAKGEMSKFVCFEPLLTVTGTNADLHVPVRPGDELKIALSLVRSLTTDSTVSSVLGVFSLEKVAKETGIDAKVLQEVVDHLSKHKGESLILGGGTFAKGNYGRALHIVVNYLNTILNNDGATLDAQNSPSRQSSGSVEELIALIDEMHNGKVDLLLVYNTNPNFSLPRGLRFEEGLKKVPVVVSFADRVDETAKNAHWVLPVPHALESWGDAEPQAGLFSLFQPTIAPLYDTRSFQESLLKWTGKNANWHDYLKNYWQENVYRRAGSPILFETFWETSLRDGVVNTVKGAGSHAPRAFNTEALLDVASKLVYGNAKATGIYLISYPTIPLYDGRHANNSWLMELPDPVTKITWRNYVSLSPAKASELHLKEGDVLKVKTDQHEGELPLHIQPGLHKDVAAVPLGFGRSQVGRVANEIGVNAFLFGSLSQVTLAPTGKWIKLAATQQYHSIEGRPIIKETTLEEYKKDPKAGNEGGVPLPSMWSGHKYEGHRWGMAIDLNSCTGCSACMIGCQAENNIPVVGEKRIKQGREMHWIRIDRYYSGEKENPEVSHQPMLCQHCENAPCETVCPVVATLHDDEGLNVQVYNRCVGTRYCSNNCPYKVRRFNWYEYLKDLGGPLAYALNPDVTVREKGVMEKCTFCTQRIQAGKEAAKDLGKKVSDGDIKTACQQSCPAEAIVFGDLNDPESQIAKLTKDPRGYKVIEDLNTKPQITYLTKVRNKE